METVWIRPEGRLSRLEDAEYRQEVGRKLKAFRALCGLKQADIAPALDVVRSGVSDIEKGLRPVEASKLLKLSDMYGVRRSFWYEDLMPAPISTERDESMRCYLPSAA
jgi:transcriptional regulator with XRE-family HTH domain